MCVCVPLTWLTERERVKQQPPPVESTVSLVGRRASAPEIMSRLNGVVFGLPVVPLPSVATTAAAATTAG